MVFFWGGGVRRSYLLFDIGIGGCFGWGWWRGVKGVIYVRFIQNSVLFNYGAGGGGGLGGCCHHQPSPIIMSISVHRLHRCLTPHFAGEKAVQPQEAGAHCRWEQGGGDGQPFHWRGSSLQK